MIYGYARVSTDGQSVAAQVAGLRAAGAGKVFREVASGAKTDRAQLRKAIAALQAGDVLMVTRLDRLARSTRDLLNTLAAITGRKAGFRSLGDAWADTTTAHGRLMLTVLGGLAEFERDLIRTRTGEGRARAVAGGRKWAGRPSSPRTSGARRSSVATAAGNRSPTLAAATTSAARRFPGFQWRLCDRGVRLSPSLIFNRQGSKIATGSFQMVVQPEGEGQNFAQAGPLSGPWKSSPVAAHCLGALRRRQYQRECVMTKRNRGGNGCRLPLPL